MLFRMLKRRGDRPTKFSAESYETQASGDTEYLEMEGKREAKEEVCGTFSLDTNAVPDLHSTATDTTAGPNDFCVFPDHIFEHSLEAIADKPDVGHNLFEDATSTSGIQRVLDIPVISTQDPNLVRIDDCLEPIQAVVSEYSRQLTDAFFPSDEESDGAEPDLEQVVSRRHKLKRALRFKFKGNNREGLLLS